MTWGVSGRDGLALEFYGGGDLIAAGLPGHRQDGEPPGLLHRDSAPLAVWAAAPGGHRSVGARQVPAGPGTDELRCAGPMRGPGAPAARSHRGRLTAPPPCLAGRGGRCRVPCSPAWPPGAGLAAGWPRPRGGPGPSRRAAAPGSATAVVPGRALRAARWC